ncbi:hypothetical protein D9M69_617990 [compost metagenome]
MSSPSFWVSMVPISETPCVWSPVSTTSVSGFLAAKSRATATTWSSSMVSRTARSQSIGWDILSTEAASTIRKKPSGFLESWFSAAVVMSTRPGWSGNFSTVPFFN